jgi:hypothetical protein
MKEETVVSKSCLVHPLRGILALGLASLLFLAPLSFNVSAEQLDSGSNSSSKMPAGDEFILYQDANGDVVCREATAEEIPETDANPKGLRQINHLEPNSFLQTPAGENALPAHLTIILRGTAQLEQNQPAKAAFIRAAQAWENQVLSPVTIYLDVDYGTTNFGTPWPAGVLGSTSSPSLNGASYQTVRNQLIAGASNAAETSVYNALPTNAVPTDLGNSSLASVSSSIARAIGLLDPTAQSADTAARIGFNSNFAYDFDPSDFITGGTDFEAVATHEIGHALGFTSRSGGGTSTPAIWDLFRFRTGTTTGTFTSAPRIMTSGPTSGQDQFYFVPGDIQLGLSTGGPSGSEGDGNQSSHWKHQPLNNGVYIGIMDPRIPQNLRRVITVNDTKALNIFGYNLDNSNPPPAPPPPPPPPANDNFANAQIIGGCTGSVAGTNVSATKEAGEPSNPQSPTSTRSVWYRWQAPSTGNVTMTTAGSAFDTIIAVYAGTSLASLGTALATNDDIGDVPTQPHNVTSGVTFSATAGTTYHIAVDGFDNPGSGGGDVGNLVLNWTQSNCTDVWQPTTLTSDQVEIKSWTFEGRAYAHVKLSFPNAGYRVPNWGAAVRAGNDFTADALVEKFTGLSVQAVTTTAQIYDLGPLSPGSYNFIFKNTGAVVKTQDFAVAAPPFPANPIDDARTFVKWQYRDFLNREADQAGEDFWTDNITKCMDPARRPPEQTVEQCTLRQRETTSGAFFRSPEFQYTGYFVYRMYQGVLGRQPKLSEFIPDAQVVGSGIVVGGQLSGAKINQNKAAFAAQFVNCTVPGQYRCAEFKVIYDLLSNQQYVDKLFQTTGVNASAAERTALVNGLNANPATETRASVAQKVVDGINVISEGNQQFTTTYGEAFYNAEFRRAFVQLEYFGYLKRDPDDLGYAFWLAKLNLANGDFLAAEMVLAFIQSPEYRARFGQP